MIKAQHDEQRTRQSACRIEELEAQLAQLGKVEDLQRSNLKLQEDFNELLGHFKTPKARMAEEASRLTSLAEAAKTRPFEAEVTQ